VNQYESEQSSVRSNQDASAGFDMMMMEIAQAGSHSDQFTTFQASVTGLAQAQSIPVASSDGFCVGDYVDALDASGNVETVRITGVGSNDTLTGSFMNFYVVGDQIRLFAMPYLHGVIPPAGLTPNSDTDVSTLRFFGDIYGNGNIYYVEYDYDSANAQITRSMTHINDTQKGPDIPLIENIKPNSPRFTLHSDDNSVITSVTVAFTVENQWETAGKLEETAFSSKVVIPSTAAASTLLSEIQLYGGINTLPPTPMRIVWWTQYGDN
jgi:hypothetical protein